MIKAMIALLLTSFSMATASPNIIVFDFGGVMTNDPNREVVIEFLQESFSLSDEEFRAVHKEKREATKQGMRDVDFWLNFARDKGVVLPVDWVQEFYGVLMKGIAPNEEMYELVAELQKSGVPTGMLSNIDTRLARIVRELGLYEPFAPCVLSCDIGVSKPELHAYEVLLGIVSEEPEKVFFVDDKQENIDAALEAGIDAVLFESIEQLREELMLRGVLVER